MKVFCISDIHGCLKEFKEALSLVLEEVKKDDNKLILLGDYIHRGPNSKEVLDKIMELEKEFGKNKIIALLGNHEEFVLEGFSSIESESGIITKEDEVYIKWFKTLPRYYILNNTIFVHAGIDEEAGEYWELGTNDEIFTMKFPATIGLAKGINKKIVAGHITTSTITGISKYHDILYDGASHYYIDGDVINSHTLPVLMIENDKYYGVYEYGIFEVKDFDEFY